MMLLLAINKFLHSDAESLAQFWRIIQADVFQYSVFLPYLIILIWKPGLFTLTLFGIS